MSLCTAPHLFLPHLAMAFFRQQPKFNGIYTVYSNFIQRHFHFSSVMGLVWSYRAVVYTSCEKKTIVYQSIAIPTHISANPGQLTGVFLKQNQIQITFAASNQRKKMKKDVMTPAVPQSIWSLQRQHQHLRTHTLQTIQSL